MNRSYVVLGLAGWLGLFGLADSMTGSAVDATTGSAIDAQIGALVSSKMRALGIEQAAKPRNSTVPCKEVRAIQSAGSLAVEVAEKRAVDSRRTIEIRNLLARWYFWGDSTVLEVTTLWALQAFMVAAEEIGDYEACLGLSYFFEKGIEVPKDDKQAEAWRSKANRLLRSKYRSLMTSTNLSAEKSDQQIEDKYVKDAVALTMADFKNRRFGLLEGVQLDCAGRSCGGCRQKMVGGDPILIIMKMTSKKGWKFLVGHQKCHLAIMQKNKITSLECVCGHVMNDAMRRDRAARFGFGSMARRSDILFS
jgi:hypothetical protein